MFGTSGKTILVDYLAILWCNTNKNAFLQFTKVIRYLSSQSPMDGLLVEAE